MTTQIPDTDKDARTLIDGRERWVHEDHLINHRLTWLGLTQTLLFAAQGIIIEQTSEASADTLKRYEALLKKLDGMLPIIGLASSALIYCGVLAETIAMVRIKKHHKMPDYGVSRGTTIGGWLSAIGLPFLFMWAWSRIIDKEEIDFLLAITVVITGILWIVEFRRR